MYHPLGDIETFASQLLELYPRNVRLVPIGHSAENREMFALEIAKDFGSIAKKTGFVITGAQHAREVCHYSTHVDRILSPSVTVDRDIYSHVHCPRFVSRPVRVIFHGTSSQLICESLPGRRTKSSSVGRMLTVPSHCVISCGPQVFYLVLVPNPDGYVYTWETDRLW